MLLFGFFTYSSIIANAASLKALFKHVTSGMEPYTDDVIREKVMNFLRDKVRIMCLNLNVNYHWIFNIEMNGEF